MYNPAASRRARSLQHVSRSPDDDVVHVAGVDMAPISDAGEMDHSIAAPKRFSPWPPVANVSFYALEAEVRDAAGIARGA
jgi:hypothetical protein